MNPIGTSQIGGMYGGRDINQVMQMIQRGGAAPAGEAINDFSSDKLNLSDAIYEKSGTGSVPSFTNPNASQIGYNNGNGMVPGFNGMQGSQNAMGMQDSMMQMFFALLEMMKSGQMNGIGQPQGAEQGISQNGEGTVDVQKGQPYTTPGGVTINWGDEGVKVNEAATGKADQSDGFSLASAQSGDKACAAAATVWGNGDATAAAMSKTGKSDVAVGISAGHTKTANEERNWSVGGSDSKIHNADGSSRDLRQGSAQNSIFMLRDGSKLMVCNGEDGKPSKVRVTAPGGQLNMQGVDANKTQVYRNHDDKMQGIGTLDKYLKAFPNSGLGTSPQGNKLY